MTNIDPRLQTLLDKQAVEEVLARYCRALDRLDPSLLETVFHSDATVDYGEALYRGGIAEFLPFALQFQGAMRQTQHYLSNCLIEVTGDSASAESYVYAYHVFEKDGQLVELEVGARYLDKLQRRDGRWAISERSEVIDWGRERPLEDDWLARNEGLNRGQHSMQDALYQRGFTR